MQGFLRPYAMRAGIIGGIVGAVALLLSLIPIVGLCFQFLAWVVFVGTGVYAVTQSKQQGATVTIQQGGIDGAAAGGFAGVIAWVVKFIVDILLSVVGAVLGAGLANSAGDVIGSIVAPVGFSCFLLVIGIISAIIGGAIGGLIYAAIQQSQKPKAA